MIYVVGMLMLVCLAVGALLLRRGRRGAAWWAFGLAALLGLNLAVYLLVHLLARL